MTKSKPYLFAIILGVIVFFLLKCGCSTEPKIIKVDKPYQLKFDSSYFNDRLDSLAEVISLLQRKKTPLFKRQKDVRQDVDSVIVEVAAECPQVDTLITMIKQERSISDSIVGLYKRDSLVTREVINTLTLKGDSAVKELKDVADKFNKSKSDNEELKSKNTTLKKQRIIAVVTTILLIIGIAL